MKQQAELYRYFLRKIKELQFILDTEELAPAEQHEIHRAKDYMQQMAQRYQAAYREFITHGLDEHLPD
jgi:hypothetical protein